MSLRPHFGDVVVVTPKRTMLISLRAVALAVVAAPPAAPVRHRSSCAAPAKACPAAARARASRPAAAQLERGGLADHDPLAVLLLDRLIDRENPHIGAEWFRWYASSSGTASGFALAPREDDVDTVVRQDEAAGAVLRRNFGRERAHAGWQHRGHEARAIGFDQLGFADRLADDERRARDRSGELVEGLGPVVFA